MSSRKANPRRLRDARRQNARAIDKSIDPPGTRSIPSAKKTRGRRQPQAEDFSVTFDLPRSPPISDKELRAIEILLGEDLQKLLTDNANSEAESRKNSN